MKTNVTRLLCLALVLMMAVGLFAGCNTEDPVTKTDVTTTDVVSTVSDVILDADELEVPFTVVQVDGKDIVILTPGEDGAVIMTVAEKTTLAAFLSAVKAEEGYTIKVTNADGEEITDEKAVIAKDMIFEVFADGATQSEVQYVIDVITEKEIEKVIEEQKEVDDTNSKILANQNKPANSNSGSTDANSTDTGSVDSGSKPPVVAKPEYEPFEILLASYSAASYSSSDAIGKAWQSTLTTAQKQKGITTTIIPLDANSATDTIVKEVMAGKTSADVFEVPMVSCRNIARKKACIDIFQSKTLDKSLYTTAMTESCSFGGKAYGVAFASRSVNPMGVIYNKELIKKYAPEYDIPTLYDTKKWDFNTFREIAKLCTVDTNGDGRKDIYGFTSNTNIIGMALTANAGGTAIKENERVVAALCSEEGITALEWCKGMFSTDKSWKYQANIADCYTAFANGEAAMFVSYLMYSPYIAGMAEFNMGFVLMPIGPDQKEYKNGLYDGAVYIVTPLREERLDDIGRWLNVMAGVSSKLINVSVQSLARDGFDAHSQKVYKWLVNNMSAEYSSGVFSSEVATTCDSSVTNATIAPSKVMAAIRSKAQKECDDYFADLY